MTATETAGVKRCRSCDEVKPLTDFHVNRARPDGRQTRCKPCQRALVSSEANTARSRARNAAIRALIVAHRAEYDELYHRNLSGSPAETGEDDTDA